MSRKGADLIEEAITEELSIGDGRDHRRWFVYTENVACLGCAAGPVMMSKVLTATKHMEPDKGSVKEPSVRLNVTTQEVK